MKGYLIFILCVLFTFSSAETFAAKKYRKSSKSNIYVGKKFKGHKCPRKRQIINAKYF
ncbi:MAG: hypothetical protein KDD21_12195 [Bacteroidetes bacterium]|nr:hypothetical protein [Bacteroidota bacterium]